MFVLLFLMKNTDTFTRTTPTNAPLNPVDRPGFLCWELVSRNFDSFTLLLLVCFQSIDLETCWVDNTNSFVSHRSVSFFSDLLPLPSLLYKAILPVRGLFAATGHSFQDTDIWLILFDPKY